MKKHLGNLPLNENDPDWLMPERDTTFRGLAPIWKKIVKSLLPPLFNLTPTQNAALFDHKILRHQKNLIIASPTNSGKSLLGYLVLLEAIRNGKCGLLLVPLKTLAREKADELRAVIPQIEKILKKKITVHLTTGDYRIEHELFSAPPPSKSSAEKQIIIATPERIEAVWRNPDYQNWFSSLGAVCLDEAHLIGDRNRGITMEFLITGLLNLPVPPRLVLLSASLGDTTRAEGWLAPCETIRFGRRVSPLSKEIWELAAADDSNDIVLSWAEEVIKDPTSQIIIFVYQTRSAESLARTIEDKLEIKASAFHARLSSVQREKTRQDFIKGKIRVAVATTALSLGVNLPATHVMVRDIIFPGAKNLTTGEVLQMMGRAGRGNMSGQAVVLIKQNDQTGKASQFIEDIRSEKLAELTSAFDRQGYNFRINGSNSQEIFIPLAEKIGALLIRHKNSGLTFDEIQNFFVRSLGGAGFTDKIPDALAWLQAPERSLAYRDENTKKINLTTLGKLSVQSVLPLPVAAGFGQLLRDLMIIDPADELLDHWQIMDHLVWLQLFSVKNVGRKFSGKLAGQIAGWMERHPREVPVLYREWIRGESGHSQAAELLGSLGINVTLSANSREKVLINPEQLSCLAVLRSILLWERSRGAAVNELERTWQIENLSGIDENLRDEMLWLLSSSLYVWEIKAFYYHLKEECRASDKRIKRLKEIFRQRKMQIYALLDQLKYCSPLGTLLIKLKENRMPKSNLSGVGIACIRKLEQSGIKTLAELAGFKEADLVAMGIKKRAAESIMGYLRRRST